MSSESCVARSDRNKGPSQEASTANPLAHRSFGAHHRSPHLIMVADRDQQPQVGKLTGSRSDLRNGGLIMLETRLHSVEDRVSKERDDAIEKVRREHRAQKKEAEAEARTEPEEVAARSSRRRSRRRRRSRCSSG